MFSFPKNILFVTVFATFIALVLYSCGNDDSTETTEDLLSGESFSVAVLSYSSADTIGEATLREHESGAVTLEIVLDNASDFTAAVYSGSGLENGESEVELQEPEAGVSTTYLDMLSSGTAITYDGLIGLDGHVRIKDTAGDDLGFADLGPNALTGDFSLYQLFARSNPEVSGSAVFYKREDNSTLVALRLQNVDPSANHPAHVHDNTAIETGGIAIDLSYLTGETGNSLTHVNQKNDGTAITYEQLVAFDGYINVHKSDADISTLMAQGDIGRNAFTGREHTYTLKSITDAGINGSILFQERRDETILASISISGSGSGNTHPAHIHENSAAETGIIIIDFSNVNGGTGTSFTNLSQYNDGTALTYEAVLSIDGHINVHASLSDGSIVSQGDIGQNELTGEQITYPLEESDGSGVSGQISLFERVNGFTLAVVEIEGNLVVNSYAAIIYSGNKDSNDLTQFVILKSISSNTGVSQTTIRQKQNEEEITFEDLLASNVHLRILDKILDPATPVAVANMGSNSDARTLSLALERPGGNGAFGTSIFSSLDRAITACK